MKTPNLGTKTVDVSTQTTDSDQAAPAPTPVQAVAAPASQRAQRPAKKSPSRTFSIPDISSLKEKINQPEEENKEEEKIVIGNANSRREPYTEEDIRNQWDIFVRKMEAAGNHQEVMILKEKYHVNEHSITLEITNEALESAFEKVKSDILQSVRDGLKNDTITLKANLVQMDKEKMLYTDQEKFDHLKKKFPALRDLQDKLGLDPEF